ncbi:hypothetical protein BS78_02G212300 [Paspalum vaginatum]|nr:hypothetical protein BS78_02G212300 [Paspalum vaginatum]
MIAPPSHLMCTSTSMAGGPHLSAVPWFDSLFLFSPARLLSLALPCASQLAATSTSTCGASAAGWATAYSTTTRRHLLRLGARRVCHRVSPRHAFLAPPMACTWRTAAPCDVA